MQVSEAAQRKIEVESIEILTELFGPYDENIDIIRKELGVEIFQRDTVLVINGDPVKAALAETVINKLIMMIERRERIEHTRIRYAIELASEGNADLIDRIMQDVIAVTYRGKQIKSKTIGQKNYVDAIKKNTVTFAVGPAGTGKTYLAMAMAVVAYKNKEVERIILTRPAVEAGEKLGFLPGDLQTKVDPYLRPLYDAMYDLVGAEAYARMQEKGIVEVAPLAYMRGRTLQDSFIILDEAQNTTSEQMKMFLTRFGYGSKVVVTGDVTQVDLPQGKKSGLVEAVDVLKNVQDIAIVTLSHRDVIRHELVQNIVKAYDKYEKTRNHQR
ncbi:MAG: PhoH family protein [Clostridiales bacterium]|nr:PhoH family protein [Clostridiales bacterium]MBQ2817185.1 PhoH family protein [Clostridia bacterium]